MCCHATCQGSTMAAAQTLSMLPCQRFLLCEHTMSSQLNFVWPVISIKIRSLYFCTCNPLCEVIEHIRECCPRCFILENVKFILSIDNGVVIARIRAVFQSLEQYVIFEDVLNTKEHGIPQNRERWFAVGIRNLRQLILQIMLFTSWAMPIADRHNESSHSQQTEFPNGWGFRAH